jgi:NAD-dependent dihydropyrimidine dehydrogenase PreA subunit
MASCCDSPSIVLGVRDNPEFVAVSKLNSLMFSAAVCINCGMCINVCPHSVFVEGESIVNILKPDACMECGACQLNCPVGALFVDSGVGCAAAMIRAALTGRSEVTCGAPEPEISCS